MKTDQIILVGLIFLIGLAGSSCHDCTNPIIVGQDSISDNSNGLVPFKIGNKWFYNYYYYDSTGTQIHGIHYDSAVVSRDTIIGKERWYKIINLKPADVDDYDWYTNRSDGIWVLRKIIRINPPIDTAFEYVTFKYPTMGGEFWGSPLIDSTRAISTNEIIDTPLGIDTCIHYEDHYQFSGGGFHYYFAPNKGCVMLDLYSQTNSGRLYVVCRHVLVKLVLK